MGCSQSKKEKEEAISPSKLRIHFIKEAISSRNAFFAALSSYAICLKNTGAAFTDGIHPHFSHHPDVLTSPPPLSIPPPPPPPLHPLPLEVINLLMRSRGLKRKPLVGTIIEEDSGFELKDKAVQGKSMHRGSEWDYFFESEEQNQIVEKKKVEFTVPVRPVANKGVTDIAERRRSREPVSLVQIFGDLDNHFLKAFESTLEVCRMSEAKRLKNYHSNFADNRDHIEEVETLATVLNKLLALETKLYDEIKAGEVIKYDYQKKYSLLVKQEKQGSNPKSLEHIKASISHLYTRYTEQIQSAVSTAGKIHHMRDKQLYPKLVHLVDGMEKMWKSMLFQHESQLKIVYPLRSLDYAQPLNESSKYDYNCTVQLCGAVRGWHTQFCGVIEYQKDFIRALHRWLKLSLIPIATNVEEKMDSLMAKNAPPIQQLVIAWEHDLDKLPDEAARNAISNFAALI